MTIGDIEHNFEASTFQDFLKENAPRTPQSYASSVR